MNSRKWLIQVGYTALFLPVGLAVVLIALHQLGILNAWIFPLVHVSAFCIFGGLFCFISVGLMRGNRASERQTQRDQQSQSRGLKWKRYLAGGLVILLLSLNISTYLFAYYATHVRVPGQFGIGIPKPTNSRTPAERGLPYTTLILPVSKSGWLEAWEIPAQTSNSRGTVLLFPGNLGTKGSQLIAPAQSLTTLGFDTVLVDFQGVGGSSGNIITIGLKEALDVVTVFDYIKTRNRARGHTHSPVILYGVSMGSAAILRAISVDQIQPDAIILELPFARLIDALRSRLRHYQLPPFPTAELLVFWGGVQHGFNGFSHNPIAYAKAVRCPALVIHGQQDKWTTINQVKALFQQIPAPKQLVLSPKAGHHQLIGVDRQLWDSSVESFLNSL